MREAVLPRVERAKMGGEERVGSVAVKLALVWRGQGGRTAEAGLERVSQFSSVKIQSSWRDPLSSPFFFSALFPSF